MCLLGAWVEVVMSPACPSIAPSMLPVPSSLPQQGVRIAAPPRRRLQVTGCERRIVQLQHEIKRKEKDYERLQERWVMCGCSLRMCGCWPVVGCAASGCGVCASAAVRMYACHPASLHPTTMLCLCPPPHGWPPPPPPPPPHPPPPPPPRRLSHYLADKKRSEKTVLEMAGKLTQQLQVGLVEARLCRASACLPVLVQAAAACSATLVGCPLHPCRLAPPRRGRARLLPGLTRASRRWWLPMKPSRQSSARTIATSRQPWPPCRWGGLDGYGDAPRRVGVVWHGRVGAWSAAAGAASHMLPALPAAPSPPPASAFLAGGV